MKRTLWVAVLCLALTGGFVLALNAGAAGASSDDVKVASLIKEMKTLRADGLNAMQPIPIRRWEVPEPGVDVMRAQLEETYSVDGVGTDTVELTGWIAVRHGQAYPIEGSKDITWNTAILDTQFVDMELSGTSKIFGPVHITLDKSRPSLGKVGQIQIPELAEHALIARLEKNDAAVANERALAARGKGKPAAPATRGKPKATPKATTTTTTEEVSPAAAACEAPVNVSVMMPNLGLEMVTKKHVIWYSLVDTIPPVGHTASVAVEPVRLIANGREVGTLESGVVKFREVVRHVGLSHDVEQVAGAPNK
jgi:uncharacterized protein DUF6073